MPRYQLPPIGKDKNETGPYLAKASSVAPDQWDRTLTIPVNKAILEALAVDGEAVITLRGKVSGLSSSESTERSSSSVSIVISSVDAYPDDGGAMQDDEMFEDSFNKARGRFPGKRY